MYMFFFKKNKKFRIVALITCRNESHYLDKCLQNLFEQGIETCIIDNESEDNSVKIAESFKDKGVFRIENWPYPGFFDWSSLLQYKEQLVSEIDADWFIHMDVDEIREAPAPYSNLKEAIIDVDKKGFTAINFDEFVFLPTSFDENFEGLDYYKEMKYYYFFEPRPLRQIKAFKKMNNSVDIASSGGHRINFEGIKVYPDNFILRHYIVLSKEHAINKYCNQRIYSSDEVTKKGWHGIRATFSPDKLCFPNKNLLKNIDNGIWDKSDKWIRHTFLLGENA